MLAAATYFECYILADQEQNNLKPALVTSSRRPLSQGWILSNELWTSTFERKLKLCHLRLRGKWDRDDVLSS